MWSRAFLVAGLVSGFVAALVALAGMWLVIFATAGGNPGFTSANIVQICAPGAVVYPACWYVRIFRKRTYSVRDALVLVVATFIALWVVIAAVLFAGGVHVAATIIAESNDWAKAAQIAFVAPFAYVFMTAIGAVFLAAPYATIATPAAFAHRWFLLRLFPAPPTANLPV